MDVSIFISHSGKMGEDIANRFESYLNQVFDTEHLDITVAPRTGSAGLSWFSEIIKSLKKSQVLICIDDRKFRESEWCSFEVGYFFSLMEEEHEEEVNREKISRVLFPIQMDGSLNDRNKSEHPLGQISTKTFNKDNITILINKILQIQKPADFKAMNILNDILNNKWDVFNQNMEKTLNEYRIIEKINYQHSLKLDPSKVDHLKEKLCSDLKYNLDACIYQALELQQGLGNRDSLFNVFISFPLRLLHHLNQILREANGGSITITDHNFFETLWRDEIIDNVENRMWTTNTKGSQGRKLDENYLKSQEEIIRKKVIIERLFIINKEDSAEDIDNLKTVILMQAKIGIRTGCMYDHAFQKYIEDLNNYVDGTDFMILDNEFVYVTKTNITKNIIQKVKLLNNNQVGTAISLAQKIAGDKNAVYFSDKHTESPKIPEKAEFNEIEKKINAFFNTNET